MYDEGFTLGYSRDRPSRALVHWVNCFDAVSGRQPRTSGVIA